MIRKFAYLSCCLFAACRVSLGCGPGGGSGRGLANPAGSYAQPNSAPNGAAPVADGTSNTILVGETAASGNAPAAPGLSPDALKQISDALGDKQYNFGNSNGNSD